MAEGPSEPPGGGKGGKGLGVYMGQDPGFHPGLGETQEQKGNRFGASIQDLRQAGRRGGPVWQLELRVTDPVEGGGDFALSLSHGRRAAFLPGV